MLRLEAIKFNHDSSSASVDAFNVRKNETDFIEVPEWRRGVSLNPEDSPAAYAISETRGNTLTIQASFSCEGEPVGEVDIRAIDGRLNPPNNPNASPFVVLARPLLRSSVGNVLGEVTAKRINPCDEETDFHTFELKNVRIWDAGVGMQDIVWRWQFKKGTSGWTDFATTTHRIYSVLRLPTRPWLQEPDDPADETQLPWVDVLNYSCEWAAGAQNTNDAAQSITSRVHELGFEMLVYDGSAYYTDQEHFDCSAFLNTLRGEVGGGARVNCDDCAAIVSTFSNAVGCELSQLCVIPSAALGASSYGLNPHQRIGIAGWLSDRRFFHHSVAAEGCGEADEVFDACLRVDGDDVPRTFTALLPANIRFGVVGEHGYRFRLVIPEDESKCVLGNCRRRRLGPSEFVLNPCADIVSLRKHYGFDSWGRTETLGASLFASEFFFGNLILPRLEVIQASENNKANPRLIQSFWLPLQESKKAVVRIDVYECISRANAREVLMSLLTWFQEPEITLQKDIALGDVAFANDGFVSILFASGNLVFSLRNVGRENVSLTQIAKAIDGSIVNPPPRAHPAPRTDEALYYDIKQFKFEIAETALGQPVPIIEIPADPLARKRFYQFFSDKGEVFRSEGGLSYRPKAPGTNKVEIFGVDAAGNAVQQVLQLEVVEVVPQVVPPGAGVFV